MHRRTDMPLPDLSFSADSELLSELNQLILMTGRDREYHLRRAVDRYVSSELAHVQAVQEGIQDAKAGNVTSLEAVKNKWTAQSIK